MIKLHHSKENEIVVVDSKDSTINIYHQEDGMLISIESPVSSVEALLENKTTDAKQIYESLIKGDWFDVDAIYVYGAGDADEEDEDGEEAEEEETNW